MAAGPWHPVGYGVQVRADAVPELRATLQAWQLVLPYFTSFTGLTAAGLRGWWIPPLPAGLPLFVAAGKSDRISRPGLDVCRHNVVPSSEQIAGVRVTTAAETVLAVARDLALLDVVVMGDCALHSGSVTKGDLQRVARQRRRGAPLLRRALPLMDGRSESIFESLLRVLHVVCGVRVEPQYVVLDDGGFVARADLWLVGTSRVAEYDGGSHLPRARQRRDLRRTGRIDDAGYSRRGYTMEDVLHAAVTILRDADRALGRPHDPRRIDAWHALLRESLFTAQGRRRLMGRLGLAPETADKIAD
jgi:very-short-patch-repair endonuclease